MFVRAVHVTGDLEALGQGTPDDQRYFVTIADKRTILHFGSSYGGNALLGKIAHGLRQAAYDGWVSGVAKDTNEVTNPTALASVGPGTGTLFTNVAYNEDTHEVWWEGRTPSPPTDVTGWCDWTGRPITDRTEAEQLEAWAHPNSRFTTTLANVPNVAPDFDDPNGVPIDAIIFGGRTRDREPLIRAITEL